MKIYIGISKDKMSFGVMPLVGEYDMVVAGNWDGIDFTRLEGDDRLVDKSQIEKELSKVTAYELGGNCIKEVNEPNQKLFYFCCKFGEMKNCNLLGMENCVVSSMHKCSVAEMRCSTVETIMNCHFDSIDRSRIVWLIGYSVVEEISGSRLDTVAHATKVLNMVDCKVQVIGGSANVESVFKSRVEFIDKGSEIVGLKESWVGQHDGYIDWCEKSDIDKVIKGTINNICSSKVGYGDCLIQQGMIKGS